MKRPVVISLLIVALVLVCAGIGSVIYFANGFSVNNPFDRRNIPSTLEENKTLKVDTKKPLTLKVVDDAGGVTITGGDVQTIEVKATKTAYDSTQTRADAEVKTMKYTLEQSGGTITLKYELPKSMNFSNNVDTIDFVVTVPQAIAVDINTNNGKVDVSNTKGNFTVKDSF